jgi:hypothetical protein
MRKKLKNSKYKARKKLIFVITEQKFYFQLIFFFY